MVSKSNRYLGDGRLVEHIPYDETRRYIKKVTGITATMWTYFDDHTVVIPSPPNKDDPTVIDLGCSRNLRR